MTRIVDGSFKVMRVFIALCMMGMVVLVFGNVVLRYAFNSGITVSEELSRWLFVWLVFVGAVVALRDHAHLGMDSVVSRLPDWGKKACFLLSNALMLGCVWLFFAGTWQQTLINLDNMAPATGLSSGYFYYSVGLVFSVGAAGLLLRNLWHAVTGKLTDKDLIQIRESEDKVEIEKLHAKRGFRGRSERPLEGLGAMTIAIFLFSLLGAMALGMPIAFALIVCAVAMMYQLNMMDPQIIAQNLIAGADSFPLMAAPFFLLAGEVMNSGGLSKRIVNVALTLVGHVRGGLGYVVILASCILAALSGSAVADAAALSALLFPMMVKAGHDPAKSAGLIAAGGIIGPIIPPSIGFIVFGVAAGLSISKLFLAGIVPGILIGAGLAIAWWWEVRQEHITPPPRATTREVIRALIEGGWALALPGIIIFGLKFGIFTPTEAGVVCAVYALFVALFIYKELKWKDVFGVFVTAAETTAIVMFLVAAALVSAWLITVAELPAQVVALLEPFMGNQTILLLAMRCWS